MKVKKLSFGDAEGNVGHNLSELYNAYVEHLTEKTHSRVMSLNLTQWRTLTFIRYNENESQRALSDAVGIDPSSMTPIIDLFERRKWVRRKRSKTNRSAYGISMTTTGLRAYKRTYDEVLRAEQRIKEILGEKNAAKLNEFMKKVAEELGKDPVAS